MNVGKGLSDWCAAHQATPLGDEFGEGSPWTFSAVPIAIANAQGQTTHALVGWDHGLNAVMEPGAGPVVPAPTPTPPPAQTVTMYDSVTAADIPADAAVVAGYVDGSFAWSGLPEVPSGDWARFPNAKRITISVNGGGVADFWDCETGDLNPEQAAVMVQTYPGTGVYCSLSLAPQVISAMHWAGMDGQYTLWIADWTNVPHIPSVSATINGTLVTPTVVACQYQNAQPGQHYDLSIITAEFLATF